MAVAIVIGMNILRNGWSFSNVEHWDGARIDLVTEDGRIFATAKGATWEEANENANVIKQGCAMVLAMQEQA